MTFEQFEELIASLLEFHISRDRFIICDDQDWETKNFVEALALKLRIEGINVPHPKD